jgi:hypothetical protein
LIALLTIQLADTTANASAALRITSGLALLFAVAHIVVLLRRLTRSRIILGLGQDDQAGVVDLAVMAAAVISMAAGTWTTYERLLILMLARPVVAFAIVLGEASAGSQCGACRPADAQATSRRAMTRSRA